jgi:hypothetical protein
LLRGTRERIRGLPEIPSGNRRYMELRVNVVTVAMKTSP